MIGEVQVHQLETGDASIVILTVDDWPSGLVHHFEGTSKRHPSDSHNPAIGHNLAAARAFAAAAAYFQGLADHEMKADVLRFELHSVEIDGRITYPADAYLEQI